MSLTSKWKNDVFSKVYGAVGLSTSFWSKIYGRETGNEFLMGYIHDVSGPFAGYWALKLFFNETIGRNRTTSAATVFTYCSLVELAQLCGIDKGTFDPYDFLAYAAGVGLAVGVDRLTFGKEKKGIEEIIDEE